MDLKPGEKEVTQIRVHTYIRKKPEIGNEPDTGNEPNTGNKPNNENKDEDEKVIFVYDGWRLEDENYSKTIDS
jgi:hypothetical protein